MTVRRISTGSPFEEKISYSRAVVADGWVFVAGTTGYDRVNYILPNADDWPDCWPVVSEAFATAKPAATMFVAGLQNPEMKIEIEVTARLPAV